MKIISAEYIKKGNTIKAVVRTDKPGYDACLMIGCCVFPDEFNIEEPYDRKAHVFHFEEHYAEGSGEFALLVKKHRKSRRAKRIGFEFSPVFKDENALLEEYNSRFEIKKEEKETVARGVVYTHFSIEDKNRAPVHAFTLEIDTKLASLYTGTPDDGYANVNVKAKVPEMIDCAVKNGVKVVAAMNADFFDMFGDCHPSGLCVKNSRTVANADSPRPFIGIKKDGTPVITDINETPGIIRELDQAAAGLEMIVKDGKTADYGPLEPFSFVRHPRTAAGVKSDGTVILLAVDGRIPEYSNGATLVDLAEFMIKLGADRAINLDGGGSSIVYTKSSDGFLLRNRPADLIRPRAMLIRKEFNALLVVEK